MSSNTFYWSHFKIIYVYIYIYTHIYNAISKKWWFNFFLLHTFGLLYFLSFCVSLLWLGLSILYWTKLLRVGILVLFLILEKMLSDSHDWIGIKLWFCHIWPLLCWGMFSLGFPDGASGKEPTCQCRSDKRHRLDPWVGKISWRSWQPNPVVLPGESQGQRRLAGYSL